MWRCEAESVQGAHGILRQLNGAAAHSHAKSLLDVFQGHRLFAIWFHLSEHFLRELDIDLVLKLIKQFRIHVRVAFDADDSWWATCARSNGSNARAASSISLRRVCAISFVYASGAGLALVGAGRSAAAARIKQVT